MEYVAAYHTDVGISKKTNQDSLAIKVAETADGIVCFSIVCDGMGGLAKGELASKEVIEAFTEWYETVLLSDIENGRFDEDRLIAQWNEIIQFQNKRLGAYGQKNQLQLGTTVSAILIYKDQYYIVHVGDSRIYQLTDKSKQLTKDQTLIQREMDAGRLSPEMAKVDPRRSILLQCVGASPIAEPEFTKGEVKSGATYLLCSDGFRHKISEEEMLIQIGPMNARNEGAMHHGCIVLTELVKQRKETDNITVVLIRAEE